MKYSISILLLVLLCPYDVLCQELYGEQSWELTTDKNTNGWVDDGDMITYTVKVTYNHIAGQTISVKNDLHDPHIKLINGSVRTTDGFISSGNNPSDELIVIENLQLKPSWDYATITFDAVALFDATAITHVYNKTQLFSPTRRFETNQISIPVKSSFIASNDKAGFFNNALMLLSILLAGMVCGVINSRLKVTRHKNQPSLE